MATGPFYTSVMKQRVFQPRKMDVGAFIESGEVLEGATSVAELPRVGEGLAEGADLARVAPVRWRVEGESVAQRVGPAHLWLVLEAEAVLPFECQRCLQPVDLPVAVSRRIRFVQDEAAAAELDANSDDDVLALSRQFNLLELIEDELIMAEPILPRHDTCPVDMEAWMSPEPAEADETEAEDVPAEKPNPFAVLAALKKGGGTDEGNGGGQSK